MEVNRDLLLRILNETTCVWTKGFLSCLLDTETPEIATDHAIAKELMDPYLQRGEKIQAIKKIREAYGYGLKEAKAIVDDYVRTGHVTFPEDGDDDGSLVPL